MNLRFRIKPYIQPFERRLALLELAALTGADPIPVDGSLDDAGEFLINTHARRTTLSARLAFWEAVIGNVETPTTQALLEATTNVVRNGVPLAEIARTLPFTATPVLPNRRCLRYGTHGLHEYRGKFFPQLVRALINTSKVPIGGVIADPMCGSGTTIVEANTAGFTALGADINPLSVLMARTKAGLLTVPPAKLARSYEALRESLLAPRPRGAGGPLAYFASLPHADQQYLASWFSEQVLRDLDRIATAVGNERDPEIRNYFRLALSNIIRSVSWQKLDDLRVRKHVRLDDDIDPVKEFLEGLGRSTRSILAILHQRGKARTGNFEVVEHSATDLERAWPNFVGRVDTVITSPPYATALPYLDTDRLSLCYLGLLPRPLHRQRDAAMIGNREISERKRLSHWKDFLDAKDSLPESITRLVEKIDNLNSHSDVGFRRRNLAALLGRYFLDMRSVLLGVKRVLKKDGCAYVVIGNNSTTAGGERVSIETATLLEDLAKRVGFVSEGSIPMDMLVSRDIFRKNAMASEVILCLRRR